ncbi:MAG: glycosyltransferase family 4 protein [Hyphomicrobiaceae bacterium]|nr:glycosyltransferase family 4 protein [Hyphomicrobiaceae bacterium]
MRILALVTDAFGAGGGIARYNQQLMSALSQSGCVSDVLVLPRHATGALLTPANVRQLQPSPGRASWSARSTWLAMRQRFDVVFCGHLNALPVAAWIAGLQRAPLWVQVHGIEAWEPRGTIYRHGLATAALVTSVSRYTRRKLLAWADIAPARVRVLPNTFASTHAPRQAEPDLVARLGLAGRRVILTVGRLSADERYKGHDRIIGALPEVLRHVPDAVYLIVGSGDDQPRLADLARQTGMSDYVIFAGQVPDAELPAVLALADVFAMPSTGEGFGIVFLEAAAAGLPVIGGNRDGSLDALADGAIGRPVDPNSPQEITTALIDALSGRTTGQPAAVRRFAFPLFADHVDRLVRTLAR